MFIVGQSKKKGIYTFVQNDLMLHGSPKLELGLYLVTVRDIMHRYSSQ